MTSWEGTGVKVALGNIMHRGKNEEELGQCYRNEIGSVVSELGLILYWPCVGPLIASCKVWSYEGCSDVHCVNRIQTTLVLRWTTPRRFPLTFPSRRWLMILSRKWGGLAHGWPIIIFVVPVWLNAPPTLALNIRNLKRWRQGTLIAQSLPPIYISGLWR